MLHVHDAPETTPGTPVGKATKVKEQGTSKNKPIISVTIQDASATTKSQPASKKRPASAPSSGRKKPPVQAVQETVDPSVDLRSYSKSLRLLGLDIPSNRREATKVKFYEIVLPADFTFFLQILTKN
jgi:hypothetical protein